MGDATGQATYQQLFCCVFTFTRYLCESWLGGLLIHSLYAFDKSRLLFIAVCVCTVLCVCTRGSVFDAVLLITLA